MKHNVPYGKGWCIPLSNLKIQSYNISQPKPEGMITDNYYSYTSTNKFFTFDTLIVGLHCCKNCLALFGK